MKKITLFLAMVAILTVACQTEKAATPKPTINYPTTKKIDHVDTYHGVEVADPYRWLEDDRSEETGAWVKAQNEVTFGYLKNIPFKAELQSRIEKLNDYEKVSAPFKEGAYEYFYKNDGLQDHSIVYRTKIEEAWHYCATRDYVYQRRYFICTHDYRRRFRLAESNRDGCCL